MRMSDIIKLKDKNFSDDKKFPYIMPAKDADKEAGVAVSKYDPSNENHKNGVEDAYNRCLAELRWIFERAVTDFEIIPSGKSIRELMADMIERVLLSDANLTGLFMRFEENKDNYLQSHSVNVALLSVMLGIWLNYNKSDLNQLATAAYLHDIGMIKVLRVVLSPKELTPLQRKEVNEHPVYGSQFVSRMADMDNRIIEAVANHHNRTFSAASDRESHSQIIGLADTLEAMTHPRSYRRPLGPHAAMRLIIEDLKENFSSKILKALVDNIGIYPVGTWVMLDTEEVGRVIDVRQGFPLSPKINILFDKGLRVLVAPRIVDLSKQKNIHIKSPLDEKAELMLREQLMK